MSKLSLIVLLAPVWPASVAPKRTVTERFEIWPTEAEPSEPAIVTGGWPVSSNSSCVTWSRLSVSADHSPSVHEKAVPERLYSIWPPLRAGSR